MTTRAIIHRPKTTQYLTGLNIQIYSQQLLKPEKADYACFIDTSSGMKNVLQRLPYFRTADEAIFSTNFS